MRVLLVQPLGNLIRPGRYVRNCYVEPIGLEYLAGVLKEDNHTVLMAHPLNTAYDFKKTVRNFKPSVIGYSVYTYAQEEALNWARSAKDIYTNVINVFGGYHPTACLEIVKNDTVDYVITGEGEEPLLLLVQALHHHKTVENIPGLSYIYNGDIIHNPSERMVDIDCLPHPLRDYGFLKQARCYQLSYPPPSEQIAVAQVVYSRGCPYCCDFCSNENMWGTKVYWRDPKNVVDEIQSLHENYGTNLVFFADLTFNLNKEKVHALCEELQKKDLPVYWWAMCRVDHLEESLIIHMKEAKCSKITVGLETLEKPFYEQAKVLKYPSSASLGENLHLVWSLGLIVRATLMIGYPWADRKYYEVFLESLLNLYIDEVRMSFYTPFPGTKLYETAVKAGSLVTKDFSEYTTDKPILKNRFFDSSALLNLREHLTSQFYLNEVYKQRSLDKIEREPRLKKSFIELFDFLVEKSIVADATPSDDFFKYVALPSRAILLNGYEGRSGGGDRPIREKCRKGRR